MLVFNPSNSVHYLCKDLGRDCSNEPCIQDLHSLAVLFILSKSPVDDNRHDKDGRVHLMNLSELVKDCY